MPTSRPGPGPTSGAPPPFADLLGDIDQGIVAAYRQLLGARARFGRVPSAANARTCTSDEALLNGLLERRFQVTARLRRRVPRTTEDVGVRTTAAGLATP